MGFEDLLRKRLGPLQDLVARPRRTPSPRLDSKTLFYRRAAGIEARVRPEESWADLQVGMAPKLKNHRASRARPWLGLTEWKTADALGLNPDTLWRAVEDDILVFAQYDPGRPLSGQSGILAAHEGYIARRGAVWPTVAVETAVEIAPMPFMPRGRDLAGAEAVGVRLASLERGHETFGLTMTGTRATGRRWRRLLPLLDGRRTRRDILECFSGRDRHEIDKTLTLLDDCALLEAREGPPSPSDALAAPSEAQVTWLGHAAVFIQTPSTHVMVDPLFFAPSEPRARDDNAPRFDPRALPRLDAILITHGDNDHLNPNSLAMLDPDVPVMIPECPAQPSAFQVDLKGMLRVLGFRKVIEMPPYSAHVIGDVTVTACPFEGEDWGLDLSQATYLVESTSVSVYLSADARRMDDVMDLIAERPRRVDLAFFGVSGNAEPHVTAPELGYGNFYADWIPRHQHNEWVQHCGDPADAVESARRMRPRYAFGYASGGAPYIRTAYSDYGDHETFVRLMAANDLDTCAVNLPLGQPVRVAALEQYRAEK